MTKRISATLIASLLQCLALTITASAATDDNALSVVRTTGEVMSIVKPFYPNGLNGAIK